MVSVSAETTALYNKKCKQCGNGESCWKEQYDVSALPQEACWMPTGVYENEQATQGLWAHIV